MNLSEYDLKLVAWGDHEDFTTIEESELTLEYKSVMTQDIIVKHNESGMHFRLVVTRHGDQYEPMWSYDDLVPCYQKEVVTKVWVDCK